MTDKEKVIIDKFIDFLISENCEGCKECEPRLSCKWKPEFACMNEGQAKWFIAMGKKFKERED